MKIIHLLLLILLFFSCGNASRELERSIIPDDENEKTAWFKNRLLDTVTYEGCEYMLFSGYSGFEIVHKGNCKNPIHYGGHALER